MDGLESETLRVLPKSSLPLYLQLSMENESPIITALKLRDEEELRIRLWRLVDAAKDSPLSESDAIIVAQFAEKNDLCPGLIWRLLFYSVRNDQIKQTARKRLAEKAYLCRHYALLYLLKFYEDLQPVLMQEYQNEAHAGIKDTFAWNLLNADKEKALKLWVEALDEKCWEYNSTDHETYEAILIGISEYGSKSHLELLRKESEKTGEKSRYTHAFKALEGKW